MSASRRVLRRPKFWSSKWLRTCRQRGFNHDRGVGTDRRERHFPLPAPLDKIRASRFLTLNMSQNQKLRDTFNLLDPGEIDSMALLRKCDRF